MSKPPSRPPQARRGGVYILVLGAATLLTVVGLTAVLIARSGIRQTAGNRDWNQAGLLAQSSVDAGLANVNSVANWRSRYTSGGTVDVGNFSTGKSAFRLDDPVDGDIATGVYDPIDITGVGQTGSARRLFRLRAQYTPPPTFDALKCALYAQQGVNTSGTVSITGAPLRTANSLTNSGTLTADVRALGVSNSGTIIGYVRTGIPQLLQTQSNITDLEAAATAIPYSSISGGIISNIVLSPASNPYGAPNARGIYSLTIPLLGRVRIRQCRIVGTLVVRLAATAALDIEGEVNWDRPSKDLPTLVIIPNLSLLTSCTITGNGNDLSESTRNVNFNPSGAPYNGATDSDKLDTYPSVIRGIIQIVGVLSPLTLSNARIEGIVLSDSPVTINNGTSISYDAGILLDPPPYYKVGTATMRPVPGSWTWVTE